MTSMTIRRMDDELKRRLRIQAAQHDRSMEEEARDILRSALAGRTSRPTSLVDSIRAKVEPLGGIDISVPERSAIRIPPDFTS